MTVLDRSSSENTMNHLVLTQVPHGSAAYQASVALRNEVLRKPQTGRLPGVTFPLGVWGLGG
jgi:hypothetical protein